MIFRYDDAEHKYYGDDKEMPSVTRILKADGHGRFYKGTAARDRGTRIHEATEVYDTLGVYPVDEEVKAYVEQWARFVESFQIEESETQVYNVPLWYAGTFDRVGIHSGFLTMLDIKTGSPAAWHGLQLGAYVEAHERKDDFKLGVVVYLKPTRYTLKVFPTVELEAQRREFVRIRKGQL